MIRIDLSQPKTLAVWRENPIGAFYELAKRAPGETALLDFTTDDIIIIQDAGRARHILRENGANYRKNFGGFLEFFGTSRITADGEHWEKLHKLSQPYINASRPEAVVQAVNRWFAEAVGALLEGRDAAGGVVVDMSLSRAAAAVVSEVALGFDELKVTDSLLDDFRSILELGSILSWNLGGVRAQTPEKRKHAEDARKRLTNVIEQAIANETAHGEGATLLRDLDAGRDDGVDVVAEVCSLLFAGFDTSASALGWGLFLLAAMPELQRHLRKQIYDACSDKPVTAEALSTLPDLLAFQNEVLRIFPPIPVLGRTSIEAETVGSVPIRRDQRVIISIIGLHHDPKYFDHPSQVRFTRYRDGLLDRALQGHLLPFGAGRRMCGGTKLANAELTAAFALLIRELEFNLPDQRPLEFKWTASLRRKDGQYLLVRPAPPQ
jgi:enediyne biosynthesis protein E7